MPAEETQGNQVYGKAHPVSPDFEFELALWRAGVQWVAGGDEVGRGALAGPVAAAAVIFPPNPALSDALIGVKDSKQMTPKARQIWAARIPQLALAHGVGFASNVEIDQLGIAAATRLAVQRALDILPISPGYILLDYLPFFEGRAPHTALVKGDARSLSIAAASVIAKVARDTLMCEFEAQFPGYGFAANKGYGTLEHRQALRRLGPCEIHRRSFRVKNFPEL